MEIQWNYTVKFLFEAKDISYKSEVVQNRDHAVYKFLTFFCLLLRKLYFRWSKIIRIDSIWAPRVVEKGAKI